MSARLDALEQRLEHDLALGRHAAIAGELESLAAEHALPRAPARAADARALPLRPPGRRARRLPPRPPQRWSRTSAWTRARSSSASRPRSSPRTRRSSSTRPVAPAARRAGRARAPRCPSRRRRCSAATTTSRPPPTLLADPGRPAAHADRAGRDRQDALRARARPPRRAATSPTARSFVALAALDDPARVIVRDRPGARRDRGRGADRRARPQRAAARARQLRAAARRRARARPAARRLAALQARGHEPRRAADRPPSTSSPSRRCPPSPRAELFVRRARALNPRLQLQPGDERADRADLRAPRRPAAGDRARRRAHEGPQPRPRSSTGSSKRLDLLSAGLARRAAAPADAARGDRLELRPARPDRADDCSSASACSSAASRSRPPRRSAGSTRSTASPRWSSTAC